MSELAKCLNCDSLWPVDVTQCVRCGGTNFKLATVNSDDRIVATAELPKDPPEGCCALTFHR